MRYQDLPQDVRKLMTAEIEKDVEKFFDDLAQQNKRMSHQITMELNMMEHLLLWGVCVGPVPEMIPYYEVPTMRLRMEMPPSFVKDHPNSVILGPGERLERLTDTKTGWDEHIS